MQAKLYEKLKQKKEFLKKLLDSNLIKNSSKKSIVEKWQEYTPSQREDFSVVVSDGSFIKKQYLGFYLGAFSGYGYFYDFTTKQKADFSVGDILISVAKKDEFVKSYLSLLMFLSEAKTLLHIAKDKKTDLIIFDGTLTSRLITPFPRSEWFIKSDNSMEDLINSICLEIIEENKQEFILSEDVFSVSFQSQEIISKKILEKGLELRFDIVESIMAKLSYYEMMLVLTELFKLREPLIIGLAKTSSGTDIFKESLPDIKLFSEYSDKLGFSADIIQQDISKLKSSFGEIVSEMADFLSELDIVSFYSKYSSPRHINLIEVYQNPDKKTVKREEILDMLASISIDGYPFFLKKTDNEVKITKADLDFIARELGLERMITGRENL